MPAAPKASAQMPSPACDGFELLPVASEQMLLRVCDGSKPSPVSSKQMPSPAAPEMEQEPSSAALEQMLLLVAPETE